MQYKLTLPADFFADRLSTKLLQGIVRDLRPMGVELHFDIPGLELRLDKGDSEISLAEFEPKMQELKELFTKHYEASE